MNQSSGFFIYTSSMKNILITGAAGNLGAVVVDYFISKGHKVFALVSPGKAATAPQKENLSYWEADLTQEEATIKVVDEIVVKHGQIDAAFLLAGGFAMGSIAKSSLEAIHKMIAINFDTAYTVARASHAHMSKEEVGGKIVFVGSKPALELAGSAMLGYTLSKAMLFNLSDILNKESNSKVSFSVIVPSTIDTPTNRQSMPKANFNEWIKPETIANELEKILLGNNTNPVVKLY
jgi:NAD(P)-dependent dehydrogenase (short-subunit alcohol dehydrogenase family)